MIKQLTKFRQTLLTFSSIPTRFGNPAKFKPFQGHYFQVPYIVHHFSTQPDQKINATELLKQAYESLEGQDLQIAEQKFQTVLNTISPTDFEEKSQALIGIAGLSTLKGDPQTAINYLLQAEEALKTGKIEDAAPKSNLYYLLGRNYRFLENLDEALKYSLQALKLHQESGQVVDGKVGMIYYQVGKIYKDKNELEEAILYMIEAAEAFLKEKELDPELAFIFHDLGSMLMVKEEFSDAIKYMSKAREMYESMEGLGNNATIADLYYYLGLANEGIEEKEKAIELYKDIYELLEGEVENPSDPSQIEQVGDLLEAVGDRLIELEETETALNVLLKAVEIFKQVGESKIAKVGEILHDIGTLYGMEEDYENSIKYLKESIPIKSQVLGGDNVEVGYAHQALGNAYLLLGRVAEAEGSLLYAMEIFKAAGDKEMYNDTKILYKMIKEGGGEAFSQNKQLPK